ncbi:hypothetical protein Pmani_037126 [Petrolisthes manimaculis]|uniref:Uncharacterized protein n=1 Tax=Petrolisthes manimaculis TaxID=1843537 RepID=A0AAE1NGX3_9EUCA|nr:hypothetical protein Pmani_037126 [Petrolisthes manimaculis]
MPYHTSSSISACFTHKLATHPSFSIVFMGDSKLRILFYSFLQRTDNVFHYNLKTEHSNDTETLAQHLNRYVSLHEDIDATTEVLPGLQVTFWFRIFAEVTMSDMELLREVQQLRRWATGLDKPPDLLVLGYTAWMMKLVTVYHQYNVLSYLIEMHELVVPLLEQVG